MILECQRPARITVEWREVERRASDWRMRSPSDDERDNITRFERGPQGSGGVSGTALPGLSAGVRCHRYRWLEAAVKPGVAPRVAEDQAKREALRSGKGRRELTGA